MDRSEVPLFVSLTYPDNFPADAQTFKRHLDHLGRRVLRRWPQAAIIWRLEFQTRKSWRNQGSTAPHYHLFFYHVPLKFPCETETGKSYRLASRPLPDGAVAWTQEIFATDGGQLLGFQCEPGDPRDDLRQRVSRHWYDIVASREIKHFRAGTRVEELRSLRGAVAYAGKRYVAKAAYIKMEGKPGRFWGVIGRGNLKIGPRETSALTAREAVLVRRVMRRYRRANTPWRKRKFLHHNRWSAKLYCDLEFWLAKLKP